MDDTWSVASLFVGLIRDDALIILTACRDHRAAVSSPEFRPHLLQSNRAADRIRVLRFAPTATTDAAMSPARLAILKLVAAHNGQNGALAIEAMMTDSSGIAKNEWAPICDQLDALEDLGLIRQEVAEAGDRRYWITNRGRNLVGG
jgi:hypothetical protein